MSEMYFSLFHCESDWETVDDRPYRNDSLLAFYAETAAFVNDPEAIRLELLGNNTVQLHISDLAALRFSGSVSIAYLHDCSGAKTVAATVSGTAG